jgi:hypothetical protein
MSLMLSFTYKPFILSVIMLCRNAECRYAERHINPFILSATLLSVIMLSVTDPVSHISPLALYSDGH